MQTVGVGAQPKYTLEGTTMLRFFAYVPLGTAICLLALDMALISYVSFADPTFSSAKYMGISSISAIFFAIIGRFTIKALDSREVGVSYDKIAKTAHRMELADTRRKSPRVATVSSDDTQSETAMAQAS